ncbi:hypothetical protein SETIT_8G010700v2 [Setaria italica]|uniref:Protein LURP-one-related 8 n=2 Tax=Setaria italica TaxID=4555 RepID=A0A368S360_SETIT|nr:protein LURP-one-related 8 [Setaria italica]RCV36801.1 hypothetical protein SETIT_8G010700v2 [Setaria italica]
MVSRNHPTTAAAAPARHLVSSAAAHAPTKTVPAPYKYPTTPLPPPPTPIRYLPSPQAQQPEHTGLSPLSIAQEARTKMAKVHPNAADTEPPSPAPEVEEPPTVLTVWRKSLLFNCDGFTVFDAKGDLAFRVDCYGSGRRRAEVVLMDVAGKPLLTVRRKRLSFLAEHWVIYDGDAAEDESSRPLLSVRRHVSLRASKALAHVTPHAASATSAAYVVEGSYGQRACAVRDARGDAVAEVRRKESVGDDVFRLVADPRLGAQLAMGLVIALDEMFAGGRGRSARSSLLRRTLSA